MTPTQSVFPKWILIVTAIFALLEIGVSMALCFSPESVADNVDMNAKGVQYIMYMWAARQFALGVTLAYAAIKRSTPMLTLAYLFMLVMFIGDLLIGIKESNSAMIITALVMCAIAAALLYFINKRKTAL